MSIGYLKVGLALQYLPTFSLLLDNSLLPVQHYTKVHYNEDYNTLGEFFDKIIYESKVKSHIQLFFYLGIGIAGAYIIGRMVIKVINYLKEKNKEIETTVESTNIMKDMSFNALHHLYVKT